MNKIIVCKECGASKEHHARGMCNACYRRIGKPFVICKNCKQEKPHHAKGLCNNCYQKQWYSQNSEKCKARAQRWREKNPEKAKQIGKVVICRECGQERRNAGYGLCKACYLRYWRDLNPEKAKAAAQRYHERHREERNAQSLAYYYEHWEERNRKNREYCKEHEEEIRERRYIRYWENPEEVKAYVRQYYKEHREERLEYARDYKARKEEELGCSLEKKWREENPEKALAKRHRRRAREANVHDDLTAEQIMRMYTIGRCFYCGEPTNLTLDHFVPIHYEGNTTKANMVLACRKCNSEKHTKLPQEVLTQLRFEGIKERRITYEA